MRLIFTGRCAVRQSLDQGISARKRHEGATKAVCHIIRRMTPTEFARMAQRMRVLADQGRQVSDRVEEEHAGVTFAGTAGGGLVTAAADLYTRIVDIRIVRSGLTRTHGGELARYVVEAVAAARECAREAYVQSYRAHAKELTP